MTISTDELFDSLVGNAIDFFRHSIGSVAEQPKYALINFCAAVELILKARLMKEHWSLIVANPSTAKQSTFESGQFHSANMDDVLQRLRDVAGENLSKQEEDSFLVLRRHRNRLVHFFHEAYSPDTTAEARIVVLKELFRGWVYLQRLVSKRWKAHFDVFTDDFVRLDRELRQHYHYLQAKFDESAGVIQALRDDGHDIVACSFCGFLASGQKEVLGTLAERKCVVCDTLERVLPFSCPDCNGTVELVDVTSADCETCGRSFELQDLLEIYGTVPTTKDDESVLPALCTTCWNPSESVIEWEHTGFLCLHCLTVHDVLTQCEYCGAELGGEMEDTYLSGCVSCEGRWPDIQDE